MRVLRTLHEIEIPWSDMARLLGVPETSILRTVVPPIFNETVTLTYEVKTNGDDR